MDCPLRDAGSSTGTPGDSCSQPPGGVRDETALARSVPAPTAPMHNVPRETRGVKRRIGTWSCGSVRRAAGSGCNPRDRKHREASAPKTVPHGRWKPTGKDGRLVVVEQFAADETAAIWLLSLTGSQGWWSPAPRAETASGGYSRCRQRSVYGAIAQLGERLLCKQEVTGSNPVGSIEVAGLGVSIPAVRYPLFCLRRGLPGGSRGLFGAVPRRPADSIAGLSGLSSSRRARRAP